MKSSYALLALVAALALHVDAQPVVHARVGITAASPDSAVVLTLVGKKQNYSMAQSMIEYHDDAVNSPKSANVHPDGKKYYVNSLEGCQTIVYDMATHKRLKVITHHFGPEHKALWSADTSMFKFTHYPHRDARSFWGKPVESAFSHGGRYLWVPYYRRTFDLNAQDPSAIAVIDTQNDTIIRLFDTGPLPKMIACSNDGKHIAVTHWGNNTVGLIDVASDNPSDWHYLAVIPAPNELHLNFSLTSPVNRDSNSGLLLRGTVFTPDDRYVLVGEMGGGGIGVIDVASRKYLGRLSGCSSPRHLVINNGFLYLTSNSAGLVQRCPLDSILAAVARLGDSKSATVRGWETCKVGGGARTIELSPSGNYAFVACNSASRLCVVDTRQMKQIAEIPVDSYPVGLALSLDGKTVIVTSQGRKGGGGNAVNIYRVDYAQPEPVIAPPPSPKEATDSLAGDDQATASATRGTAPWVIVGIAALAAIAGATFFLRRRK